MKTLRCTYYDNPENTSWRGLLTNLNDKKRNLMRKSHTIIQSLNIVPIDKPKSSIAPNFGNPLEEEEDTHDDIEEKGVHYERRARKLEYKEW